MIINTRYDVEQSLDSASPSNESKPIDGSAAKAAVCHHQLVVRDASADGSAAILGGGDWCTCSVGPPAGEVAAPGDATRTSRGACGEAMYAETDAKGRRNSPALEKQTSGHGRGGYPSLLMHSCHLWYLPDCELKWYYTWHYLPFPLTDMICTHMTCIRSITSRGDIYVTGWMH